MFVKKDIENHYFHEGMLINQLSHDFIKTALNLKNSKLQICAGKMKPKIVRRFFRKPYWIWISKKSGEIVFDTCFVPISVLNSMNGRMRYSLSLGRKYKKFKTPEEAIVEFEKSATYLVEASVQYIKSLGYHEN